MLLTAEPHLQPHGFLFLNQFTLRRTNWGLMRTLVSFKNSISRVPCTEFHLLKIQPSLYSATLGTKFPRLGPPLLTPSRHIQIFLGFFVNFIDKQCVKCILCGAWEHRGTQ